MGQKDIIDGIERYALRRSIGKISYGKIYNQEDFEVVIGKGHGCGEKRLCTCAHETDAEDIAKALDFSIENGLFRDQT